MGNLKEGWNEYIDICKRGLRWFKNYWFLYILMSAAILVPFFCYWFIKPKYNYTPVFIYAEKEEEEN